MKKPIAGQKVQFVFLSNIQTGKVIEVNGKTVLVETNLAGKQMKIKIHCESIIKIKS